MKLCRLSRLLTACVLASLPLLSTKADFGSADTGSSGKSNTEKLSSLVPGIEG